MVWTRKRARYIPGYEQVDHDEEFTKGEDHIRADLLVCGTSPHYQDFVYDYNVGPSTSKPDRFTILSSPADTKRRKLTNLRFL